MDPAEEARPPEVFAARTVFLSNAAVAAAIGFNADPAAASWPAVAAPRGAQLP